MICPVCKKIEIEEPMPSCLICWVSGRYMSGVLSSPERESLLPRIRSIPSVVKAAVVHQGEGLFSLLVAFSDGRLVNPQAVMQVSQVMVTEEGAEEVEAFMSVPAIPPQGARWTIAVGRTVPGEESAFSYEPTFIPSEEDVEIPGAFTDEELVEKLIEIAP